MSVIEQAVSFTCAGESLLAIVAGSDIDTDGHAASCGVLIVVGGPQYRVGSHRQFLLLSRYLAGNGFPTMRFDYRGMGDSSGAIRSFEAIGTDIGTAIDAFQHLCPTVERVVLWGLCDAASAALLYVQETRDKRIAGLVLLNPWVRSESSLAKTQIKHYYGQRLLTKGFWEKLLLGRLDVLNSLRGFVRAVSVARCREGGNRTVACSFQERMAEGWHQFSGRILLILSEQDYTAKEFLEFSERDPAWVGWAAYGKLDRLDLADADHTFSSLVSRRQVEDATLAWLGKLTVD